MAVPYDSVYNVVSSAKTRLNDQLNTTVPVSGKILVNTQAFSQQTVNTAWRKFQEFLANLGYVALVDEILIENVPPTTDLDPASQVYINWFGYFDGTTLQTAPVLPQSLITPLRVMERQTGTQASLIPMENIFDGLPTWGKGPRNRLWEWRQNAIYMPGATFAMDLRIRFISYLPDFADTLSSPAVPWFQQPVPIMRCQDALSWFIAAELASARGDLNIDAKDLWARGEAAAKLIMNRDARMKQRGNIRRASRSGRLEANAGGGSCWGN
jgi:hypothetical protein